MEGKLPQATYQELAQELPLSEGAIRLSLYRLSTGYTKPGRRRYAHPYCLPIPSTRGYRPFRLLAKGRKFIKRIESERREDTKQWLAELLEFRSFMREVKKVMGKYQEQP